MGHARGDRADGARLAYEAIGPAYGTLTADHHYGVRLDNLSRTSLGLTCGAGKSFLRMLERSWAVIACGVCPSMAEQGAHTKAVYPARRAAE